MGPIRAPHHNSASSTLTAEGKAFEDGKGLCVCGLGGVGGAGRGWIVLLLLYALRNTVQHTQHIDDDVFGVFYCSVLIAHLYNAQKHLLYCKTN